MATDPIMRSSWSTPEVRLGTGWRRGSEDPGEGDDTTTTTVDPPPTTVDDDGTATTDPDRMIFCYDEDDEPIYVDEIVIDESLEDDCYYEPDGEDLDEEDGPLGPMNYA